MKKFVIPIIVLFAILTVSCGKRDQIISVCKHENDSLKLVIHEVDSSYSVLYDYATVRKELADSLQKQLNLCLGIPEPMTVDQRLAAAEKALAEMKANEKALAEMNAKLAKRPTYKKTPVKTTQTKIDVSETSFSAGNDFTVRSVTTTIVPEGNNAPASTQYSEETKGAYLTTIDGGGGGYLTYKVIKTLSAQAPRLNTANGPLFFDDGAYWTYVDKSRLVSVAEINYATVIWTISTGNKNYGTGSYPMFLPHELLKSLIVQARGYDYGGITSSDVARMAQTNPQVGKSLVPNSANGHSATDQNFWNGWSFKTKIVAVKRTTTINSNTSFMPVYQNMFVPIKTPELES